jgi:mannose-1-phosphate guanylyltransferase / mannose-6-phosphate isomerase
MSDFVPIIPVILCGGAGERLWPYSRSSRPKQFLKFGSEYSLFQNTLLRCSGPGFDKRPIIVSGEIQRFLIAEDLRSLGLQGEILLEPMRRDSCAAVAAGCLQALRRSADAMVIVLAADHNIDDDKKFIQAVLSARGAAVDGLLLTFGVKPNFAATEFGYIKPGNRLASGVAHFIERFVEKPDHKTAQHYLESGYLWNSGNFLFKASRFIEELKLYAPAILNAARAAVNQSQCDQDFVHLNADAFARSPKTSIDYAVMEKTKKAAVVQVDYHWNDVGSWDAIYEILKKDESGNALIGDGLTLDARNNLAHISGPLTTLVGVDDLIVVTTADAVLVTKRGQAAKLKTLISELKVKNRREAD